jgi:hypothetical protein
MHVLSIRNERQRSPKDMFLFGMIQNGMRGLEEVDESSIDDIGDIESYGIDWVDYQDNTIITHHDTHNRPDLADPIDPTLINPFCTHRPQHLSHVKVEQPNCPLSPEQLQQLDNQLEQLPCYHTNDMDSRRLLWILALEICDSFFSVYSSAQ